MFLLFQHILEIDHGREYSVVLRRWVREDWREGTLEVHCQWETYLYTEASSQSILFGKFILLVDKFFSSCGEDVSGFLPLPPNLLIFISSFTVLDILTD